MLDRSEHRPVLSVSALARAARVLVEEHFPMVWVEGELSNFRKPASGHWYFTLKDDTAQLRCAMFAGRNRAVHFTPRDGTQVLLRGRVSFYEPRGDFQLIAEHLEPAGEGALRAAFEALKARLEGEGLFAPDRKRPLPAIPRRLAVISSASGAAVRDVLHVIARRFPILEVVLLPVAVQGDNAEGEVLDAVSRVPAVAADVVLITRGGGSLEDLWTFNLESVARALAACTVPTVSAVGHQTDFTITDFVADVRAPTPSAGAELITPDKADFLNHLQRQNERLQRGMDYRLERHQRSLAALQRNLALLRPAQQIAQHLERLRRLNAALHGAVGRTLTAQSARASAAARTLQAVSPLATLGRGYAVLTRSADGSRQPVTSVARTQAGETLTAHLHDGALDVRVEGMDDDNRLPRLPEA